MWDGRCFIRLFAQEQIHHQALAVGAADIQIVDHKFPLAAGETVKAGVVGISIADNHGVGGIGEPVVHIDLRQQIFSIFFIVHIMRFAEFDQLFPFFIAAVYDIFIQYARGFQNIHTVNHIRIGDAFPLRKGFAVGALAQVIVPPVLTVQINDNYLACLIVQIKPLGQLLQGSIPQTGGVKVRIGVAQQNGGITVIIPIFEEGIVKCIAAVSLAGIHGKRFLLADAHGFARNLEGAHLADAKLPVFVKILNLAGILQILHVIGGAARALYHDARSGIKQVGIIGVEGHHGNIGRVIDKEGGACDGGTQMILSAGNGANHGGGGDGNRLGVQGRGTRGRAAIGGIVDFRTFFRGNPNDRAA